MRGLLPRYAAGVLDDESADEVRAHLAGGCGGCLRELFERPVGVPLEAAPAPEPVQPAPPPVLPSAPAQRRLLPAWLWGSLLLVAVGSVIGLAWLSRATVAGTDRSTLSRRLTELRDRRAALSARLAALERAPANAEATPEDAARARASTAEVDGDLRAAQQRIRSLKQAMRRQQLDFEQKQKSLEAVIARRSEHAPGAAIVSVPNARHSGCIRLEDPARGVCNA